MNESKRKLNWPKEIPKLTPAMRSGLMARIADRADKDPDFRKKVLAMAEAKGLLENNPRYLNEFHKQTTEDKINHLQSLDPSKIDWPKELKQQKKNAKDD